MFAGEGFSTTGAENLLWRSRLPHTGLAAQLAVKTGRTSRLLSPRLHNPAKQFMAVRILAAFVVKDHLDVTELTLGEEGHRAP